MTQITAQTLALPWRQRNAAIEAAARDYLGRQVQTFSTYALAQGIAQPDVVAKVSQILSKLAPYMQHHASHDGEEIRRYGKTWRRWRWHGQMTPDTRDPTCVLCESGEEPGHEH